MNTIKKIYSKIFYEVDLYWYYMFNYEDLAIEICCNKYDLKRSIIKLLPRTPYMILSDELKEIKWVYTIVRK